MNDAEYKSVLNTLVLELKVQKLDFIEKAHLFKKALELEKKRKEKGTAVKRLAQKIGLSENNWKEVYRCMKVLEANKKTRKLIKEGKIKPEKVARILYNLKDASKENEVIRKAIKEGLPTQRAEREVSELNNPKAILKHLQKDCRSFIELLKEYETKLGKLEDIDKLTARQIIGQVITMIDKVLEK